MNQWNRCSIPRRSGDVMSRTLTIRRHGLPARLSGWELGRPLVCICDPPRPRRLDGIWWALDVYECDRCGRKVVT